MATEIKPYSTLLGGRLTIAQDLQFHLNVNNHAGDDLLSITEIAALATEWRMAALAFDNAFRSGGQRFETIVVQGKDTGRDYYTRALVNRIYTLAHYPVTDEEKADGVRLYAIVETYRKADKREYEIETTFLRNFVSDLRKQSALLAKYSLTDIVDKVDEENTGFDEAYNERMAARQEAKEAGSLQEHRKDTNAKFDKVAKAVTGLILMTSTPDVKNKLAACIGIINSNIDQFNAIYHRHAGIVAKHKKKDGDKDKDKEDNGEETPDTNPPATPGDGTQKPDTGLQQEPGISDQNPSGGPHHLDPNEHPAMGE
ncbi:MAG: DUF6261 family protein [Tannerellaceae bacterium]|jgi:hypothetical protein|nr:DUF6261 family protein [Tannerellaceae bacterium]